MAAFPRGSLAGLSATVGWKQYELRVVVCLDVGWFPSDWVWFISRCSWSWCVKDKHGFEPSEEIHKTCAAPEVPRWLIATQMSPCTRFTFVGIQRSRRDQKPEPLVRDLLSDGSYPRENHLPKPKDSVLEANEPEPEAN